MLDRAYAAELAAAAAAAARAASPANDEGFFSWQDAQGELPLAGSTVLCVLRMPVCCDLTIALQQCCTLQPAAKQPPWGC